MKLPKLLETAPFAQFGPREYEQIRTIVNAHNNLINILVLALPCVEESEEFNKPHTPKLSTQIRDTLTKLKAL